MTNYVRDHKLLEPETDLPDGVLGSRERKTVATHFLRFLLKNKTFPNFDKLQFKSCIKRTSADLINDLAKLGQSRLKLKEALPTADEAEELPSLNYKVKPDDEHVQGLLQRNSLLRQSTIQA